MRCKRGFSCCQPPTLLARASHAACRRFRRNFRDTAWVRTPIGEPPRGRPECMLHGTATCVHTQHQHACSNARLAETLPCAAAAAALRSALAVLVSARADAGVRTRWGGCCCRLWFAWPPGLLLRPAAAASRALITPVERPAPSSSAAACLPLAARPPRHQDHRHAAAAGGRHRDGPGGAPRDRGLPDAGDGLTD